jgi:hypothetical protein
MTPHTLDGISEPKIMHNEVLLTNGSLTLQLTLNHLSAQQFIIGEHSSKKRPQSPNLKK